MLLSPDDVSPRAALPGADHEEPLTRLICHMLAYKTWIIGAAILGLALSGIALCFTVPIYKAEAVVVVDSRRNKLADAESALSGIVIDQYMSALKSELDLMSSPDIARHVISSLDLLLAPEYASAKTHVPTARRFEAMRDDLLSVARSGLALVGKHIEPHPLTGPSVSSAAADAQDDARDAVMQNAVKIFDRSFVVTNDPKSLTIRLSYRSASPDLAAAITNAVLHRYLADDEELKAAAAQRDLNWLQVRIATLHADLATAEQAVEDFRAGHDLGSIGDRALLQQVLLQLEQQQVDAQTQLASAQAKIESDGAAGAANVVADSPDALGSRLIQSLRTQEATLAVERARLLGAKTLPNDPQLAMVTGALAAMRTTIATEVHRIALSNGAELQLAQMRLNDLSGRIADVQARINAANAADIKLRSLEAEAASKQEVLNKFAERYDQEAGTPLTPPDARVVSWASVPVDANSPHYGIDLAGGTLGFAFLAFCLSLAHERMRSGFGGAEELEAELGLVVAGLTLDPGRQRGARRRRLLAGDPPPMRELAMTVRALAHTPGRPDASRVVLVTSALAGEGKSTVALSLARNAASGGQRCLLIDADIRNPSLHTALGMPATPGLVELTLDRVPFGQVARRAAGETFDFVSAGRPTPDTLGPFTLDIFGRTLAELKQSYDVIVLDSAPILLASEVLVLVGCADMTLFLVKWRTTPREIARKAAGLITRCSAGPCLAVLSRVDLRRMRGTNGRRMEAYYLNAYGLLGQKRGQ